MNIPSTNGVWDNGSEFHLKWEQGGLRPQYRIAEETDYGKCSRSIIVLHMFISNHPTATYQDVSHIGS